MRSDYIDRLFDGIIQLTANVNVKILIGFVNHNSLKECGTVDKTPLTTGNTKKIDESYEAVIC